MKPLIQDPYNIILAGVGGQGNVMGSRILANMLSRKGYFLTIGETFGASQRGGSVMSHLRVSAASTWSPQIPKGKAHIVIALEPVEAIRILAAYGNREVIVLTNTRPVHPVSVIAGESGLPGNRDHPKDPGRPVLPGLADRGHRGSHETGKSHSQQHYHDRGGQRPGSSTLRASRILSSVIEETFPKKLLDVNRQAFQIGRDSVK